jgi:hypothetical protein
LIDLILSLDYEIFGNGAGDVMRDVVRPTGRLLDICDRHGATMTILFEVGEYWAFEQYEDRLRRELGHSPSQIMREQAVEAIRRGHDVQLHLHPQWIGAEYAAGGWRLCHSCWRLADLPDGLGDETRLTSVTGALSRGKQTLEEMIRPVKADYECVCFRAGGFYAQPSRSIIQAMRRVGLRVDSSVVRGYRRIAPFAVDYSCVETDEATWWTTDAEFTEQGRPGENVLELPVSSRMEPYWNNFKPAKIRAALRRRQIERAHRNGRATGDGCGISSVPSYRTILSKLLSRHASSFDFCKLSCKDMLKRIREIDRVRNQPVVMIGHSKDFLNDREFDEFLDALSHGPNVRFVTVSEAVQTLLCVPDVSRSSRTVESGSRESQTR